MALRPNIGGKKRKKKAADQVSSPASAPETMNAVDPNAPVKRKRKGPSISSLIAAVIMIVGLGVIGYPTFSDWWNSYHQSRAIANYVQAVEQTDPKVIESMLKDAHDYNQRLLSKGNRYMMSDEEKAEYDSLLNLGGDGVMGFIQINIIGVNLPIYHGVDESVLQVAIGHIQGSSLPVGGASTHAAVSGHRGLPSAKLFTDLDKLVEGDTFTITILNETMTYLIDQIRIVEPEDMSDLNIAQGEDYVTLITCTPYGINTHRMLVRGHRIENMADALAVPAEAVQIPSYIAVPAVAIPMLFVYLVITLIYLRIRKPEYDKEKVLQEIRELEGTIGKSPKAAGTQDAGTTTDSQAESAPSDFEAADPEGMPVDSTEAKAEDAEAVAEDVEAGENSTEADEADTADASADAADVVPTEETLTDAPDTIDET